MPEAMPSHEVAPDRTAKLSAVIGPKNQIYYLRHFERFERGDLGLSWHWPAMFVAFYWMLYRKLYVAAILYFLSPYIAGLLCGLVGAMAVGNSGWAVLGYYGAGLLMWIIPPLFANRLYYSHCTKLIRAAELRSRDPKFQLGELQARGGTSRAPAIVITVTLTIAVIGVLAAIALPAYQDYVTRAKVSRIVAAGASASAAIRQTYHATGGVPSALSSVDLTPVEGATFAYDSRTGVISAKLAFSPLSGKSIDFAPYRNQDGAIDWRCRSDDIVDRYLPRACRNR
ncbi:MAG: DUF2628 domain-containing protein [Rhodocyclaceae bacterium]